MPDFTAASWPGDDPTLAKLAEVLLNVSLTGIMLLQPLYEAGGTNIVDLAWVRLNPAAQQMLQLPERPTESFLTLFPTARQAGVFGFYCQAFLAGQPAHQQLLYQHDGLDGYYVLAAQRHEGVLVVSFTDGNEPPRPAVENALRDSQARAQAARAEAELQQATLQHTLAQARQQVQQLTEELETRVTQRTTETQVALHEAQRQREQLEEQQSLLRQILGQAPAAVATFMGPEHRYGFFNDQYQAFSAGRAVLGHTVAEVFPPEVAQLISGLLGQVYATGQPAVGSDAPAQLYDPATGQLEARYVDFIYQPLRDGQGQLQGVLAFILDTTEEVLARRQAETLQAAMLAVAQRRAHERQELFHLLQRAPVATALLSGPEHRIEYYNTLFEQLYPGSQLPGRPVAEAYPGVATPEVLGRLDRVYQTGETYQSAEVPLAGTPPEAPRYISFTYQAYYEDERIVGVAVFVYEVTERVRARQQLEAQQAELKHLFEQAPVAICVFRGPDYVLELVNPLMGEMWGYAPAQLTGRPFFAALPELAGQGLREVLDEVRQTGTPFAAQAQPIRLARHAPDEIGYYNFVYQPIQATGKVTSIVCVATEVTGQVLSRQQVQTLNQELADINKEMRATNEELHASNARLTRTNADLDTFVYSASHDLKSPITNIEGLLTALRQQLPPEALQAPLVPQLLGMMDGAVTRFQQTLGHLTDVSRLQQALFDQPAEAVDLPALVEAVRLDMLPELTAAGATLTLDVDGCPAIRFSIKNLRSILYNLLSNAVKYRDPARPAQVLVRCRPAPGQVVLEVQDNGLGLSATQQAELFRLFRRLHSHVSGSGVGLYMVKKMVDNAGGTLAVHSQPGVGSTFTVALPAAG